MTRSLGALAFLWCVLVGAGPASEPTVFVFERLNGTYTDLGGDIREIRSGPVVVRPTSPANRFQLHANRLELTPLGAGEHRALFWVHFEGEADVEAELLMGSLSGGRLTDEVTVPAQERTLDSRIKLERQDQDYLITIVDAPETFDITVQSRLAGQLVSLCEAVTRFTFGSSCDGLEVALSNPRLPMPDPGKEFVLESGQMTAGERAQLEAYLASSR